MIIILTALLMSLWFSLGIFSFIFWWTKDFDLTVLELPMLIGAGFMGPISFLAGWIVHGESFSLLKIVIKQKKP